MTQLYTKVAMKLGVLSNYLEAEETGFSARFEIFLWWEVKKLISGNFQQAWLVEEFFFPLWIGPTWYAAFKRQTDSSVNLWFIGN